MSKSSKQRETAALPGTIVTEPVLSATEPHFVAPGLVEMTADGAVLIGGVCKACGAASFPKAAVCPECLAQEIESQPLPRDGVLYSFAVVHQAPKGWKVPYVLGYVDLPDGIRVLAHIDAAPGVIAINQKVQLGVARVGTDAQGAALMSYAFAPAGGRQP